MAYIELDDYSVSVSFEELDTILEAASDRYTASKDEVRAKCEKRAESKIRNFLSAKYNLDIEFSKTGDDRNASLLGVYVDLSLCSIYKAVSPDDIPEMRQRTCEMAIQMLEDWRDGNQDLIGLLPPPADETSVSKPEFVQRIKFISHPDTDPLVTDQDPTPLEAPSDLATGSVTASEVELTWTTNSENKESGMAVERSEDNINFQRIVTLPIGTITYTDSTVSSGTTYYYRVLAIGNETYGNSDYSDTVTATTP